MLFHTLFIASTALFTLGAADSSQRMRPEDPKCPEGTHSGFQSSIWQFNTPAEEFINKIGSFFKSEWYIGPVNATHGKDNTVGSTRSGGVGTADFTEELVGYYQSPTQSVMRFSLAAVHGDLGLDFTLVTYTEETRVMSICGGMATYLSMTATYCTDKVANAYDFYSNFRAEMIHAVAKKLNAFVFTGTCPVVEKL